MSLDIDSDGQWLWDKQGDKPPVPNLWQDQAIVGLVRAIHKGGNFPPEMLVLADRLEELGADESAIDFIRPTPEGKLLRATEWHVGGIGETNERVIHAMMYATDESPQNAIADWVRCVG